MGLEADAAGAHGAGARWEALAAQVQRASSCGRREERDRHCRDEFRGSLQGRQRSLAQDQAGGTLVGPGSDPSLARGAQLAVKEHPGKKTLASAVGAVAAASSCIARQGSGVGEEAPRSSCTEIDHPIAGGWLGAPSTERVGQRGLDMPAAGHWGSRTAAAMC